MKHQSVSIVSLGCAKNTIDSDSMAQLLFRAGYETVSDPRQADVIIVNTCGFIDSAKEESYSVLAELAKKKKRRQVLIAAGCLTQRYGSEVSARVPGVDGIIGTRRWMDIVELVEGLREGWYNAPYCHLPVAATVGTDERDVRRVAVQGASAYLKIADGCRRSCAFCAIPMIKGTSVSRPLESICAEAEYLQGQGIREIILISQDTTDYGADLGMKNGLAHLLESIGRRVPSVDWIRIMYAYPGYVTDELIEVMAGNPRIVPYLDIPLQHAHPAVLKRMNRPSDIGWVRTTLAKMRKAVPDLALRTTFIVGYPGETEEEFETLLDFVEEIRFDKLGAFTFSFEEGTPSEKLGDTVPAGLKEERLQRLMERQQSISLEENRLCIGRTLDVLIEGAGDGISVGRSYRDAPEIDGLVLVKGELTVDTMVPVRITGATVYDLEGEPNPLPKR
jgi:ribosomal protein S12 methylthiotransferase